MNFIYVIPSNLTKMIRFFKTALIEHKFLDSFTYFSKFKDLQFVDFL